MNWSSRWLRVWPIVLAAFLLPSKGHSQQAPQETFADELEVTEVLLDVLVTDKSGGVVIGLGADDFLVEEEGEPVELTSVTFYSSRELLGSKRSLEEHGLSVDETAESRYFILFFQQQRQAAADVPGLLARQMEAGRDVADWLAEDLQVRDLAAVVVFDTRLAVVQDFTNNIEDLQQAVAAAVQGRGGKSHWPSRQPDVMEGPSLLRHLPVGRELGKAARDTYEALQVVAKAAGEIRGRKMLVFFGRGVGEVSSFGVWEPDSRYYEPTVNALNDNNIAVYPLSVMPQGSRHTLEQSLSAMASETGGTYHRQYTSFTTPLGNISDENGGYYLLSYQARKEPGESGYQRVKVKLRNPELVVQARHGYLYGD